MDEEAALFVGLLISMNIALLVAWIGQRREVRRLRRREEDRDDLRESARFAQIEQAVDAIAVEVERVATAQRVTAQMLGERIAQLPRAGEKAVTPH